MKELIELLNSLDIKSFDGLLAILADPEHYVIVDFPPHLEKIRGLLLKIFDELYKDKDADQREVAFEKAIPKELSNRDDLLKKIDLISQIYSYYFYNEESKKVEHKNSEAFDGNALSIDNPGKILLQINNVFLLRQQRAAIAAELLKKINNFAIEDLQAINADKIIQNADKLSAEEKIKLYADGYRDIDDVEANHKKIKELRENLKDFITPDLKILAKSTNIIPILQAALPDDPSKYSGNINAKLDLIIAIVEKNRAGLEIGERETDVANFSKLADAIEEKQEKLNQQLAAKYVLFIQAISSAFNEGNSQIAVEACQAFGNFLLAEFQGKSLEDINSYLSGVTAFRKFALPDLKIFTALLKNTQDMLQNSQGINIEESHDPNRKAVLDSITMGLNAFSSLMGDNRIVKNAPAADSLSDEQLTPSKMQIENQFLLQKQVVILESASSTYKNELAISVYDKLVSNNLVKHSARISNQKKIEFANLAMNAMQNQGKAKNIRLITSLAQQNPEFKLALDKYTIISNMHADVQDTKKFTSERVAEFAKSYQENEKVLTKNPDSAFWRFLKKIVSVLPFVHFDHTSEEKLKGAMQTHGKFAPKKANQPVTKPPHPGRRG